jgi:hypothetical protein
MRCKSRDFLRMAGWGRKTGTRWLADCAQKAYTNRGSEKIVARAADDKPV